MLKSSANVLQDLEVVCVGLIKPLHAHLSSIATTLRVVNLYKSIYFTTRVFVPSSL